MLDAFASPATVVVGGAGHRVLAARLETCIERRTIKRLRREQPGKLLDLAGSQQFRESDVASEQVAACANRDDDVVGRLEIEILPKLIGDRFRSLQEERLPVVTGVEDLSGLPDRFVLGLLARSLDELHLGAVHANL